MMSKHGLLAVTAVCLVGAGHQEDNELVKTELASLAGRWKLVSGELRGQRHAAPSDPEIWYFDVDQVTRYSDSKKAEAMRFEIEPNEKPKHLDLVPIQAEEGGRPDGLVTRTKCLYGLERDELRIASTSFVGFVGAPQDENQRKLESAGKRPISFDTKAGDTLVITFVRYGSQPWRIGPMRTWTSKRHKRTAEAELVSVDNGQVRFRRIDNREFLLPLEDLSEPDQQFVRDFQSKAADGQR
jgi:uncharacterized protein (TIGR03067 family)